MPQTLFAGAAVPPASPSPDSSRRDLLMQKLAIRVVAAIVVLGALGVLFVRSARDARATPYTVSRDQLTRWTLALDPASERSGRLLSLQADPMLSGGLFKQIFARAAESMSAPAIGAIPIVLTSEFDAAMAAQVTPQALLQMARTAGLDQARPEPVCVALRRVSEPGVTRQAYFVLFSLPAFDAFRRQVAARLGTSSAFDASAQSPVALVAASDDAFERWLPIHADAADCTAPITVQ